MFFLIVNTKEEAMIAAPIALPVRPAGFEPAAYGFADNTSGLPTTSMNNNTPKSPIFKILP